MKTVLVTLIMAIGAMAFQQQKAVAPQQFSVDFKMVRTSPMLEGEQMSYGKMTYKAPQYVRWEYTSPEKAVYEMNGEKDNLPPQVKRLTELINACVDGEDNVRDFQVTRKGNVLTIVPLHRDFKRVVKQIVVEESDIKGVAKSVEITETNGGMIKITFSNVRTGK